MKNKQTETKFKASLGVAGHLFSKAVCLVAVILICSSAFAQNLFVSDFASGNIYEFTSDGVRSTFASGLSGAIAFDKAGNLFVTDRGNGAIDQITPGGLRTTFASGLGRPIALAFDSADNLFVTTGDQDGIGFPINGSGKIYKLTPSGVRTTFASGLDLPNALAFNSAGNLFVADETANISGPIYEFTPAGGRTTFTSELANPEAIAFDNASNLFVAGANGIYKFTPAGAQTVFASGFSPFAPLAFDSAGNLFVSDLLSGNIYKFAPDGVRSTFASGLSGYLAFQPATLQPAQLLNISTRLKVLTGDNVAIGGFVISGSDNKQVLLRARGPSLSQVGVGEVLADPTLELHDGTGAVIASNDNWKDTQQAGIAATQLAPTNDLESAILITLAPGNYTAVLRGINATNGVALVEAYDLSQSTNASLINISTRGFVDINDNVMIGGFISNGTCKVIVRALGPTLAQFSVPDVLADPSLELHDINGTLIVSNENWQDTQQAEIVATGLAPSDDREAAVLATLIPGSYTAIVRGQADSTGVALVEVYNLESAGATSK